MLMLLWSSVGKVAQQGIWAFVAWLQGDLEHFLTPNVCDMAGQLGANLDPRYQKLNSAVAGLVDDYSMVSFVPLDINDEDSIADVLTQIDMSIQYGEDIEVKVPRDMDDNSD
jgi:GPN-loop GTPase